MFSFTPKQRKQLNKTPFYKPFETNAAVVNIVNNQYYPAFRPIITNKAKVSSHLELVSVIPVPFTNCQFLNYRQNGVIVTSPTFCIQNISVTFYDERFGVGIYSFELKCIDPATNQSHLHFNDLTSLAVFARNFDHQIQIGSEVMTMVDFIEDKLLKLDDKGKTIKINDTSGDPYFSGPKMKTWIAIDLPGKTEDEYKHALYELGTCGKYGTAVNGDLYSASQSYFDGKIADQLSVFKNWTALCLWDSFSMIGNDYKGNNFDVWNDTYFKVYKYNLYYKYYLFKVNSDLSTEGRLGVTRKELLNFINKYDQEVISYNFLPNLIFQHMKKALDSKAESDALLSKIESSNTLLQEHSALFLNWFLGIIAFLSLVSILGDASGLYDKLYGVKEPDPKIVSSNTWLTLWTLVGAIIVLLLLYWFKRNSHRRHH